MKSGDKFLVGIVIGVISLVILAVVIVVARPGPEYQDDGTPEGVAHNYLLALQKEDYQRAHSYLSRWMPGYPLTAVRFEKNVEDNSWRFRLGRDRSLAVVDMHVTPLEARVTFRETLFYSRGLFESGQSISTFDLELRLEQGSWKIFDGDQYFVYCWDRTDGCR